MAFDAFISYSHAADDRLGEALQRGLHRLACPWYRLRALRVFRDKTSLSASPALWSSIVAALSASKHFILLASPQAASSHWVRKEVAWWLENRPIDSLFVAVTAGRIAWDAGAGAFARAETDCLPPELQDRITQEPLWVDLRGAKTRDELSLRHSSFRSVVLDLAAPLHERPKDELDGEDVRQHRRARLTALAGIATLAALTVFSAVAALLAIQQSQTARARELAALSAAQGAADPDVAVRLALEAWAARATVASEAALRQAVGNHYLVGALGGGHAQPVVSVAASPDESLLASSDRDQAVNIWSLDDRRLARRIGNEGANAVWFSADGALLVTAGSRQPRAWHVASGELATTPPATRDENLAAVLDRERDLWIVSDEDDGLLSWAGGSPERRWTRLKGGADRMQLLEGGRKLMTVSRNSTKARILETERWKAVQEIGGPGEWVQDAAVAARAGRIAVASGARFERSGDHVLLADYRTGETLEIIHSSIHDFHAVALDADAAWLATGGPSGTVQLWSAEGGRLRREYRGHRATVRTLAILAERPLIVSSGDDGRILLWRKPTTDVRWRTRAGRRVEDFAIGGREPLIAAIDEDGTLVLVDASREDAGVALSGHSGRTRCLAVSRGGDVLAGTADGLWRWRGGKAAERIADGEIQGCGFQGEVPVWSRADGRVGRDGSLLPPWQPAGPEPLAELSGDIQGNGQLVIARGLGLGKIAVGKVNDSAVRLVTHPSEGFRLAASSPEGDALYACSEYGPLRRFETTGYALTLEIALGGRSCEALAISPDDRFAAIGDEHGNIHVFWTASGDRVKTLNGPMRKLASVAFGSKSSEIAAVDETGQLLLFECDACLELPELLALAHRRLTRELSASERALLLGPASSWLGVVGRLFR